MYKNQTISILGCGWYGLPLAKALINEGYRVNGSTTRAEKLASLKQAGIKPFLINFQENGAVDNEQSFFDCDVLIISIPPKRSSAEQHTYLSKIKAISESATARKVPQIIFISSTSVYGDQNVELDENTLAVPDSPSGDVILAAEKMLLEKKAFQTTVIRFGGLFGPDRNPGRFFAGKTGIANGKAPVNLIHQSDCIGITLEIINKQRFGNIYNACAPEHPTRAQFYTAAAKLSGLEAPVFKDELLNYKIVNSLSLQSLLNYHFKFSLNSIVSQ